MMVKGKGLMRNFFLVGRRSLDATIFGPSHPGTVSGRHPTRQDRRVGVQAAGPANASRSSTSKPGAPTVVPIQLSVAVDGLENFEADGDPLSMDPASGGRPSMSVHRHASSPMYSHSPSLIGPSGGSLDRLPAVGSSLHSYSPSLRGPSAGGSERAAGQPAPARPLRPVDMTSLREVLGAASRETLAVPSGSPQTSQLALQQASRNHESLQRQLNSKGRVRISAVTHPVRGGPNLPPRNPQ